VYSILLILDLRYMYGFLNSEADYRAAPSGELLNVATRRYPRSDIWWTMSHCVRHFLAYKDPFLWAPVRPNMLNTFKSASAMSCRRTNPQRIESLYSISTQVPYQIENQVHHRSKYRRWRSLGFIPRPVNS